MSPPMCCRYLLQGGHISIDSTTQKNSGSYLCPKPNLHPAYGSASGLFSAKSCLRIHSLTVGLCNSGGVSCFKSFAARELRWLRPGIRTGLLPAPGPRITGEQGAVWTCQSTLACPELPAHGGVADAVTQQTHIYTLGCCRNPHMPEPEQSSSDPVVSGVRAY